MHIQKKTTISGEWAKKGEDVKDGDSIIVLDEGEIVTGDFGDSHVFKVKTDKGDKLLRFNQTSLNNMVDAFGTNSAQWVNKVVKVWMIKVMVGGKMQDVVFLSHPDAEMDDEGRFKLETSSDTTENSVTVDNYPTEETEGISSEDTPF